MLYALRQSYQDLLDGHHTLIIIVQRTYSLGGSDLKQAQASRTHCHKYPEISRSRPLKEAEQCTVPIVDHCDGLAWLWNLRTSAIKERIAPGTSDRV